MLSISHRIRQWNKLDRVLRDKTITFVVMIVAVDWFIQLSSRAHAFYPLIPSALCEEWTYIVQTRGLQKIPTTNNVFPKQITLSVRIVRLHWYDTSGSSARLSLVFANYHFKYFGKTFELFRCSSKTFSPILIFSRFVGRSNCLHAEKSEP